MKAPELGWQKFEQLPLFAICGLLFLLSLTVRLVLAIKLNYHATPRLMEFERIASTLAATGEFGNPYRIPTGPTAHHAPIYPLALSWLYQLFGTGANGRLAQVVFNCCAASLQYALLPVLAVAGNLKRHVGILAGLAGAILPVNLLVEINSAEALAGGVLLVLFLFTMRSWQSELTWHRSAALGLGWGIALLLMPSFLTTFLVLTAAGFFLSKAGKRWLKHAAWMSCCVAVTLLPWTLRNYLQFGKLFFVRSNLGLELYVSNNDLARAAIDDNEKSGAYRNHPFSNDAEARRVAEIGEIAYQQEKLSGALSWIKSHPLRFAQLTGLHLVYFWFPKTTRKAQMAVLWMLTAAGLAGLWRLFGINRVMAWGVALIWASFPLAYYFLQASGRYRFPIHWTFLLTAAMTVSGFVTQFNVWNHRNLRA